MIKLLKTIIIAIFFSFAISNLAAAAPILNYDLKVVPKTIIAGSTMDIPLYLVENRGATETSMFTNNRTLISVYGRLKSLNSKIVSFTPVDAFDSELKIGIYVNQSQLFFELSTDPYSTPVGTKVGIPVTIDNSGIVGRTEILIGYVRFIIGAEIPQDDGIGDPDPSIIFEADFGFTPPYNGMGIVHTFNNGEKQNPVVARTIRIHKPDSNGNTPNDTPPPAEDACPADSAKTEAGVCGCGSAEQDVNNDKVIDCGTPSKINVQNAILVNKPNIEFIGDNLSIIMEAFAEYEKAAVRAKNNSKGGKAPKIVGTYEVTAKLKDSKLKCGTVKLESKKNTVKLKTKNLIGGTYDVSYKLIFKQGDKKVGQTSQSPAASVDVISTKTKCPPKKKK